MDSMLTTPVGSMKTSAFTGVTLSEGGHPSIIPPNEKRVRDSTTHYHQQDSRGALSLRWRWQPLPCARNCERKSVQVGKRAVSTGRAYRERMEGSSTTICFRAYSYTVRDGIHRTQVNVLNSINVLIALDSAFTEHNDKCFILGNDTAWRDISVTDIQHNT